MFSVFHVIIFLQEGLWFNTQILKNFRLLQSSKNFHFVRSLVAPGTPSKAAPSGSGTPGTTSKAIPSGTPTRPTPRASSISPPARRGGHSGRQPSAISFMSGTGSHISELPGKCIPVVLFGFVDDIIDGPSSTTSLDDKGETSSSNQASGTSKSSGSVVMLARPASKAEGNFTKKLHSSLEGQIRLLLKKCRTLTGLESGHNGQRGAVNEPSSFVLT